MSASCEAASSLWAALLKATKSEITADVAHHPTNTEQVNFIVATGDPIAGLTSFLKEAMTGIS